MVKQKVLAYVTREIARQMQLLVFTHRDAPEAGIQVPAGPLDPGEHPPPGRLVGQAEPFVKPMVHLTPSIEAEEVDGKCGSPWSY